MGSLSMQRNSCWHDLGTKRACVRPARHTACVPRAASETISKAGLIFPAGEEGAWDAGAVSNPVVRIYQGDNEQRWFMWYTGRTPDNATDADAVVPALGRIGVAVSSDGINWRRSSGNVTGNRSASDVGACLEPDADNWWTLDTAAVALGDVQVFSSAATGSTGIYWMFYAGADFAPVPVPQGLPRMPHGTEVEALRIRPGLAMSQDGRNWARIEADHHTHALFDVGEEGEWDSLFIAGPRVIACGPKDMRMTYYTFDASTQKYSIGLARSEDGFKWTKEGKIFDGGGSGDFDEGGAGAHCVVRDIDSRQYFLFYEALDAQARRSIGLAVSSDGIKGWKRCPQPVLAGSSEGGAWDGAEVGSPCAVTMAAGKWRLYYAGCSEAGAAWNGIGVALSEEGELFQKAPAQFKRRVE